MNELGTNHLLNYTIRSVNRYHRESNKNIIVVIKELVHMGGGGHSTNVVVWL